MKPLFSYKTYAKKYKRILESWVGTPYHHMWHTKGRGADCSLFIAECVKELGILDTMIKVNYYPTDWHIHTDRHLLEDTIKNVKFKKGLKLIEIDTGSKFMFGDLLLFSFVSTGIPHHSAVYMGNNEIIQAGKDTVSKTMLDYRWKRHLKKAYRIVKI